MLAKVIKRHRVARRFLLRALARTAARFGNFALRLRAIQADFGVGYAFARWVCRITQFLEAQPRHRRGVSCSDLPLAHFGYSPLLVITKRTSHHWRTIAHTARAAATASSPDHITVAQPM